MPSEEDRATATAYLQAKVHPAVPETCSRRDRQNDRQIDQITPHSL